ncbi:MAG: hypothetical protein JRJ73_14550 [Deltaproteobacteria bacterium]|nr:hypothetical protein [Deltaproteobacteria bacterium]
MKYILLPLTMFLWYLTTYYGLYIAVIGMAVIFSLSWLWLIIGYPFLIGVVFGVSNGIPSLLRYVSLKFYGINWVTCILHSIAGIIGVVQIIRFYSATPPELVIGNESFFILSGMWQVAPIKTVFLAFPFIALIISLLWSTIIAPVYIKLAGDQV